MDSLEEKGVNVEHLDTFDRFSELNKEFELGKKSVDGMFYRYNNSVDSNINNLIGVEEASQLERLRPVLMDMSKDLLYGNDVDGFKTMGLKELSTWRLDKNSEYYYQNLRQQSGYAAEMLSTYKENLFNKATDSGITTYRADDLPDLFPRNDQYVDKVRIDQNGNIIERIQTKFVGKNGDEWLSKMMSKDFEKYLDGEHVDKLECPKDYYNDVKAAIPERIAKLEKQLERVKADGKSDVAESLQNRIDKLNKIDEMVEQSNTSTTEAMYARLHPESAAAKVLAPEVVKLSQKDGIKNGAAAACITFTVSSVDNVSAYMNGEISAEDMAKNITKDTAVAGGLGYGTAFISTLVSQTMSASSTQLIKTIGGTCLPAATVSFVVESYDSMADFSKGEISGAQLGYDLGENAVGIAGTFEGMKIGASIGSVGGAPGVVIGGVVGGAVGYAITTEAYATVIECGGEGASLLAGKAQEFATNTYESAKEIIPEKAENVKSSLLGYASKVNMPISL
ncbi:MAG: hypothetical protein PUD22_05630 [Erysipelotrichaceae bacterium]|nr:hypothetical protein [Erysipelotrichaceae bacterium]